MPVPAALLRIAALIAGLVPAASAWAADAAICRELERRLELAKADVASVQLNALLFAAADKGCAPLARVLLEAGASTEARDRLGNRPLALAAKSGQLALVDLFLDQGAPINARNLAGSTALYLAAENDRLGVVRRLLDRGADANLAGRTGVTPLAAAAFKGKRQGGRASVGARRRSEHAGCDRQGADRVCRPLGFTPIVRRLLDAGVVATARYGNDLTALMGGRLRGRRRRERRQGGGCASSIAAPRSTPPMIAAAPH